MQNDLSDEQLMQQFCAGETPAFQMLYLRHEKSMFRFIHRMLGASYATQADDVFQDTWIKLVDARVTWQARDNASFKTWLYTIAHHRAIDILRKGGKEVSADEGWLDENSNDLWQHWPAAISEQPEQQAFWRRAGKRLLECLDGLPPLQRAAFLLHHDDGLSLEEITVVLETEFETVKSRLRYALSKLRTCMGAHLPPMAEDAS